MPKLDTDKSYSNYRRKEIYSLYKKDKKVDTLENDLFVLLKNYSFSEASQSLESEVISKIRNKVTQIDLLVHKRYIVERYVYMIELIKGALQEVERKIPYNFFNIKDAIQNFILRLDPFDEVAIQNAINMFHLDILPNKSNDTIYSEEDLQLAYSKGYQDGYEKCISTYKKTDASIAARVNQLDLE
jgi:hypothetical protein